MSIKSKNALVQRLLLELSDQQLLTVLGCTWVQQGVAAGLLYLTNQKLGFMPKKDGQQLTAFPTERLIGYEFKDGMMTATLNLHFAGLPSVEMSNIVDEEAGTFVRWLDHFVNQDAARQYGNEQMYGATHVTAPQTEPPPHVPSLGLPSSGFPSYPGSPYGAQPHPQYRDDQPFR